MATVSDIPDSQTEIGKCNSICCKMRQRLWDCMQREEFCDVILETDGGEQVLAHKVVISSGSPVLYNMLMNTSITDKDEKWGKEKLRLPEVSLDSLYDIVKFSYLGKVEKVGVETLGLWERFQIYEPVLLSDGDQNDMNYTDLPEIKTEPESELTENTQTEEVESDGPENSLNKSNDMQEQDLDVPKTTSRKSRRKCATPKRKRNLVQYYEDESTDVDNEEEDDQVLKKDVSKPDIGRLRSSRSGTSENSRIRKSRLQTSSDSGRLRQTRSQPSYKEPSSDEEDEVLYDPGYIEQPPKRRRTRLKTEIPDPEVKSATSQEDDPHETKEDIPVSPPKKPPPKKLKPKSLKKAKIKTVKKENILKGEKNENKSTINKGPSTLCRTCNIRFDVAELYRKHREEYHYNHSRYHKCVECGAVFTNHNRLKAHRYTEHFKEGLPEPKWHYCKADGCDHRSVYPDALEKHYSVVHEKRKVVCEICAAEYGTEWNLAKHIAQKHHNEKPKYKCDSCDPILYFNSKKELSTHEDRVHKKKLHYLCDQCPYMGFDKYAMETHMFTKHNVPIKRQKRVYNCPHCDYKTMARNIITAHIERHEQKEFKCDKCGRVYKCNRDLKTHLRMRHSDKPREPFRCRYEGCTYTTLIRMQWKNHMFRIHENKDFKPWACEVCDYRTNVKGNLHLHLRKVHKIQPIITQHRVAKVPLSQATLSRVPLEQFAKQEYPSKYQPKEPKIQIPEVMMPLITPEEEQKLKTPQSPTAKENTEETLPEKGPSSLSDINQTVPNQTLAPRTDTPSHTEVLYTQRTQQPPTYQHLAGMQTMPRPLLDHAMQPLPVYPVAPSPVAPSPVVPPPVALSPVMPPPVAPSPDPHSMPQQAVLNLPHRSIAVVPGGPFGMMLPPMAYDENLFMQGLQ